MTFLLTDVEGSTPAWERDPEGMVVAMAAHDRIVADVVTRRGGALPVEQGEGDNAVAAFADPLGAIVAAAEIQRTLLDEWPWLRVRMAIHTGEVALVGAVYRGVTLSRCARVRGLARGGQVLLTAATVAEADELPPAFSLRSLGSHRLKGWPSRSASTSSARQICPTTSRRWRRTRCRRRPRSSGATPRPNGSRRCWTRRRW